MLITDDIKNSIDHTDDKQSILRKSAYELLNMYASEVSDKSGGFKQSGDGLFNACMPLSRFKKDFDDFKKNKIGPIYEGLDLNNSPSNHFITLFNAYLYAPDCYFDEEYFKESTLNQFIIDLCILQIELMPETKYDL